MKTLIPLWKKKKSEAEIQCELAVELQSRGFCPRLQVPGFLEDGTKCLFDIVIFTRLSKVPICIIECKRGTAILKLMGPSAREQFERYKLFGLPVFMCGKNGIESTIKAVEEIALSR
jgi:hypothetical protein